MTKKQISKLPQYRDKVIPEPIEVHDMPDKEWMESVMPKATRYDQEHDVNDDK